MARAIIELTGHRFGKWVVLKKHPQRGNSGQVYWLCRCDCGNKKKVVARSLLDGKSVSCGCAGKDWCRTHGLEASPTYNAWARMKQRCSNPNYKWFRHYGGRGISVCDRWLSFENFYKDMGEKPIGRSLDRIDNNKGYSPDNCKWSTPKEQTRNRRRTIVVTFQGEALTIGELAEKFGISYRIVGHRISRGYTPEEAVRPKSKRAYARQD